MHLRRDVRRSLAFLFANTVVRRGAWAREELGQVAPRAAADKEVLLSCEGLVPHRGQLRRHGLPDSALLAVDPPKAVVGSARRFRVQRGPVVPKAAAEAAVTKVTVRRKDRTFSCCFAKAHVTFSEVMIDVGRQAEMSPRLLFAESLFCDGCGRRMSSDEEAFQSAPAPCCRVRSLELSDRRKKSERLPRMPEIIRQ